MDTFIEIYMDIHIYLCIFHLQSRFFNMAKCGRVNVFVFRGSSERRRGEFECARAAPSRELRGGKGGSPALLGGDFFSAHVDS